MNITNKKIPNEEKKTETKEFLKLSKILLQMKIWHTLTLQGQADR